MKITATKETKEGTRAFTDGDKIIAYHTEDIAPVLRANYELRKDENNGWSKDKHFRLIGQLTFLGFESVVAHHPEVEVLDIQIQNRAWHKAFTCDQCRHWFSVRTGV